jgi:hypothetical protein
MKGNAENIDYSVYGGAVITGEYFYGTGSESSIARAVVVKLGKESVNWERLTYFQNNPQILESVIHRFLNYIGHNYERSINVIKDTVNSYRDSIPNTLFSNKRYCDYCGQYMAVGIMLMDFFKEESGITELEKSEYLIQLRENILKVLAENDSDMRQTAPINGIIQSIIYYWDAGKYGSWGNQITEQTPLILGKNGDTIFFRQKDLPEIQKQYAHKVNIPYYSMSSSQMGNLLASNGYCEKYKEGKQERLGKKYSEYGNERLMSIPIHKIVEFQQTMQCDY